MPDLALIPAPQSLERRDGSFAVGAETRIDGSKGVFGDAADWLADYLGCQISNDAAADIRFVVDERLQNREAYVLDISASGVEIRAAESSGAFRATQTLRQLLPASMESGPRPAEVELPQLTIEDAPAFSYRGAHLDVSRHFFPLSFVKRYLDWMALHKLNVFHWHLTDDQGWRIEIRALPRLTEIGAWRDSTVVGHTLSPDPRLDGKRHGGFYTQQEIREIVDYAAKRGITIIPEVDLPGHCSALLAAYPEFGCRSDYSVASHFGIFRNVLCPSDATFEMIATVLGEVAALFPGPWIHVGGDEVDTTHWRDDPTCLKLMAENGFTEPLQLQGLFLRRVQKIVRSLGRELIAWDDVLDSGLDGSIAVVAWRGDDHAVRAAREGHAVVIGNGALYFDRYQSKSQDEPLAIHGVGTIRDVYDTVIRPPGLTDDEAANVLGVQCSLWTEYVASESHAEYMTLPRMCAFAERAWSPDDCRDYGKFVDRLGRHFERLDALGCNASRSVYNIEAETTLVDSSTLKVTLDCAGAGHDIRYTTDGSAPDASSSLYSEPLLLSEATSLRATAVNGDRRYGDTVVEFEPHAAVGATVTFETEPESLWPGEPETAVVDGIVKRNGFFLHSDRAGFDGDGMRAVVEFDAPRSVSEVTVGFGARLHRQLYPPSAISVLARRDGNWRQVAAIARDGIDSTSRKCRLQFEPTRTDALRIVCANDTQAFSHETGETGSVSIYIDQIAIR